jgi:hypothetical protein
MGILNLLSKNNAYELYQLYHTTWVRVMMFNATFNNISVISWWFTPQATIKLLDIALIGRCRRPLITMRKPYHHLQHLFHFIQD